VLCSPYSVADDPARSAKASESRLERRLEPISTIFLTPGKWFEISSPAFLQASFALPFQNFPICCNPKGLAFPLRSSILLLQSQKRRFKLLKKLLYSFGFPVMWNKYDASLL